MNPKKSARIKKQKEVITEFAERATASINVNNILLFTIEKYSNFLEQIKEILNIKNNLQEKNYPQKEKNSMILTEVSKYTLNLKKLKTFLKESVDKLKQKSDTNYKLIFDETSILKVELAKNQTDNFILSNELMQKADIIVKLKESIKGSKEHSLFREIKRETNAKTNESNPYLISDNLKSQRDLITNCKQINKYKVKCWKKERLRNKKKELISCLNDIIKFLEDGVNKSNNISNSIIKTNKPIYNKKNKVPNNNKQQKTNKNLKFNVQNYSVTLDNLSNRYNFINENYSSTHMNYYSNETNDNTFIPNNKLKGSLNKSVNMFDSKNDETTNNKTRNNSASRSKKTPYNTNDNKKVKIKNKFEFLTVDELFDLNNEETLKEAIIDDELHSDDEVVFGDKIKPKKTIKTDYINEITKQVPKLYFSQIEFNKAKVMNEADLYSAQRRKFEMQNIDENLKTLKKKIKKLKKKCEINEQKLEALQNFDRKVKDSYKVLKPLKIVSSVNEIDVRFMKNEFYNSRANKEKIDEVDENMNDSDDINQYLDDDDRKDDLDDINDEDEKYFNKNKKNKIGENNNVHTMNNFGNDGLFYKSGMVHLGKKKAKKVDIEDYQKAQSK